jgi:hypothetical protein
MAKTNKAEREAYENNIIANAQYYTIVRYLGQGKGYERHERPTLETAKKLARTLVEESGFGYLIYAVAGVNSTYVEAVKPAKKSL